VHAGIGKLVEIERFIERHGITLEVRLHDVVGNVKEWLDLLICAVTR
jgi:hypothetical protein